MDHVPPYSRIDRHIQRDFTGTRYILGLIVLIVGIIFPLMLMAVRSRSVFRRGAVRFPAPFQ